MLVKHAVPVPNSSVPAAEWRLGPGGEDQARELASRLHAFAPYTLIVGTQKIDVKQGEKISIPVKLTADTFKGNVTVGTIGGPPGLTPQNVVLTPGQGGTVMEIGIEICTMFGGVAPFGGCLGLIGCVWPRRKTV